MEEEVGIIDVVEEIEVVDEIKENVVVEEDENDDDEEEEEWDVKSWDDVDFVLFVKRVFDDEEVDFVV